MSAITIQPMRKGELQTLLTKFNVHTVRAEIIDVIKTIRNVPVKEAKDTKTVYPDEVQEVLRRFKLDLSA